MLENKKGTRLPGSEGENRVVASVGLARGIPITSSRIHPSIQSVMAREHHGGASPCNPRLQSVINKKEKDEIRRSENTHKEVDFTQAYSNTRIFS